MTNFKNTRENVLALCKLFPNVKSNYNDLLMHYWAIYDSAVTLDAVSKATPAESITRAFRKLVELGMVEVDEETKETRKEAQLAYRAEYTALV